jgi:hypothetical protein
MSKFLNSKSSSDVSREDIKREIYLTLFNQTTNQIYSNLIPNQSFQGLNVYIIQTFNDLLNLSGMIEGELAIVLDDNQTYVYTTSPTNGWTPIVISATYLNMLNDTNISNLVNKHILMYDSQSNKWLNTSFRSLLDPIITINIPSTPSTGQYLTFDGLGYWKATSFPILTTNSLLDINSVNPSLNEILVYNNTSNRYENKKWKLANWDISEFSPGIVVDRACLFYSTSTSKWTNRRPHLLDLSNQSTGGAVNGDYFVYTGTQWINRNINQQHSISILNNVLITTPLNNHFFVYNSASSKWINQSISYSSSNLTDILYTSLSNNQSLIYNSTNSKFENKTLNSSYLSDFNISTGSSKHVLAFNTINSKYENTSINTSYLSDIQITSAQHNDTLTYDYTVNKFVNKSKNILYLTNDYVLTLNDILNKKIIIQSLLNPIYIYLPLTPINSSLSFNDSIEIINLSNHRVMISEGSNALRSDINNSFDYCIDNMCTLTYIDTNYYIIDNVKKYYFEDEVTNASFSSAIMVDGTIDLYSITDQIKIFTYVDQLSGEWAYQIINPILNTNLKITNVGVNLYPYGTNICSDGNQFFQQISDLTGTIITNKFNQTSFVSSFTHSVSHLALSTNLIMDITDYTIYSLYLNTSNLLKLLKFNIGTGNYTVENINSAFANGTMISMGYHLNRSVAVIIDPVSNIIHCQYSTLGEIHYGNNMGPLQTFILNFPNIYSLVHIKNNNDKSEKFYFIILDTNGYYTLFTLDRLFSRIIKLYTFSDNPTINQPNACISGNYLYITYNDSPYSYILTNIIKYDLNTGCYNVRYNAFKMKTQSALFYRAILSDNETGVCALNIKMNSSPTNGYNYYDNITRII